STLAASLPSCFFSWWARSTRRAARSIRSIASAISGSSMINGGSNRTTLSPAATASNFSARIASTNSPFGQEATSPSNKPSPRTSATTPGCRSLISASRWRNTIALRRTLSRKPGARTISSTALPAAIASGLAPKVEPWVPALPPLAGFGGGEPSPRGDPPADGFGDAHHIGSNAAALVGEQATSSPDASLNFVEDEQEAMLIAEFTQATKKWRRRHPY